MHRGKEAESIIGKNEDRLITWRKSLHRHPELSGQEAQTADRIQSFLQSQATPDRLIRNMGGHGMAAVYDSGQAGPRLLIRADMDALPIQEENSFPHKSKIQGVAHLCGHDGHTAILSGLAILLKQLPPRAGQVVLLFQGEEETGKGAEKIIKDPLFREIIPDWAFALHNLPGYPQNHLVIKEGPFAAASKGMVIDLNGRSSHAAHPEQGNSPGPHLPQFINGLLDITEDRQAFRDFALLTLIHLRLGEMAFGTNPSHAVIMATLRTARNQDMEKLTSRAEEVVQGLAQKASLGARISFAEPFPATVNDARATALLEQAAAEIQLPIKKITDAFRWSEDFGHFTMRYPGALFGMGSGVQHPGLHHHDYDFPDGIISHALRLLFHLTEIICKPQQHV